MQIRREEKRKLELAKNEALKLQLEKIEEEKENWRDQQKARVEQSIRIAQNNKNEILKQNRFKQMEEGIKYGMYRQNFERLQQIQQSKNEAMLRKMEEDQARVRQIEQYK